ncbi:putative aldo keto protein [Rosellinia necatrix]|uniref:Putative aldo keto protein n=1 Tax=Rosellinia necatrix TaxID=77044 RepID=A0A1W2TTE8_ROSNE|nr:putative aldo keto protein [Rosellinia necatrix]
MAPQIVFGTSSLGMDMTAFQDAESVRSLLQTLRDLGVSRLDTGARYPPLKPGRSEQLIGEARELSRDFVVDTKVYTDTQTDGSGDLTLESISKSADGSLRRLQRPEGVNVLYIHRADPTTPLEEQIQGFAQQIALGHCKTWGVSNMPPEVLERILQLCEQNGWPKPRYYQGTYNVISRAMETKLMPILRAHGMNFVAFWAVAAGFLTGKFVNGQHAGTRMGDDNPLGKHMRAMYGSDEALRAAVRRFDAGTRALGLTPLEVAIRWIFHHSELADGDCVLLGASRVEQVVENVGFFRKGPLPDPVLPLVEGLWESVKGSRGDVI